MALKLHLSWVVECRLGLRLPTFPLFPTYSAFVQSQEKSNLWDVEKII